MNPYPGPRPFEIAEAGLFNGRGFESRELFSLVTAHRAVLLYSESGAGKTSLVNAGLLPLLGGAGFDVLPSCRVRGLVPNTVRLDDDQNPYVLNVLIGLPDSHNSASDLLHVSLTEFLARGRAGSDRTTIDSPRVLIFDQFEELFTFYPEQWPNRRRFVAQIGQALTDDGLLRAVFVMREEYIGQLEEFADLLPERIRARFRLQRLDEEGARLAIEKPAETAGRHFLPAATTTLVDNLLRIRVLTESGGLVEVPGAFVEPVQLQVVCEQLWRELPEDSDEVSVDQVQRFGDVTGALSEFYERALSETIAETGISERQLRKWFKSVLITPEGTRGTVYRGIAFTGGIKNSVLDLLVRRHLIRSELRAGAHWYELTHDRFIEPIQTSNRLWFNRRAEREQLRSRLEQRAAEWLKSGQSAVDLLDGNELDEAERWLGSSDADDAEISEIQIFVRASRSELQRKQGELRRAIELADAQARRAEAESARAEAERARAEQQASMARRLSWAAAVFAVLFIASIALGYLVLRASRNESRLRALTNLQEMIQSGMTTIKERPDTSLLLALSAARIAPKSTVLETFLGEAIKSRSRCSPQSLTVTRQRRRRQSNLVLTGMRWQSL